jgi:membrane protease YdiL (CAAX protease family)
MSTSASGQVDGALRMTGRLVALACLTAVVFVALGVALKPVFPDGLPPGAAGRQIYQSLVVVALAVAQVVVVAVVEKGDWSLTGLAGWSPVAILGALGIGIAIPAVSALVGHLSAASSDPLGWVWPTSNLLTIALIGSLMDALLFRGYTIGLLAAAWGDVVAVALTALGAALFVVRADAPTPILVIDVFMMATCLGILRLRTGSLAAAWLAQLAMLLVRGGLGTIEVPGVTAGLLAVVSFLLFRTRSRTLSSTPR